MRAAMVVCALLSVMPPVDASAGIPERLRWVRGTVASVERDAVVTQLRSRTLRVAIDDATEIMIVTANGVVRAERGATVSSFLKAGDGIEVHYRDGRPSGTARYIWAGLTIDPKSISKGPSTSAAGSVADVSVGRWGAANVKVVSGRDRHAFNIEKTTTLMDATGAVVPAKTRLPPAPDALGPNGRIVVIYQDDESTLRARVIRMLP